MKKLWKLAAILAAGLLLTATGCKRDVGEDEVVELQKINVISPSKTSYLIGEQLDTEGLKVEAVYSDSTRKDVTEQAILSGFDSSTAGLKQVDISYTEDGITEKGSFSVTVSYELTKIEITTKPTNTEFLIDEKVFYEGMVVTATYSDGSTKDVTSGCGYEGYDFSKVTSAEKVTIKYTENGITKTTEITVSVRERKPVKVSFDANGGSGTMTDQDFIEKREQAIKPGEFTKFGVYFGGWNTKTDGSGDFYEDCADFATPADTTLYAQWKAYKILPATETGTQGTNKRYILMGMWPQTVKEESVTVDEDDYEVHGMFTYYKGDDGEWYVKQTESRYSSGYTYSDGTPVGFGTPKYFKVEPIKWCELTSGYAYDKTNNPNEKASLLLAECELTARVPYYEDYQNNRTIGGNTVYLNNYEHSQIRAYLNGNTYTGYDKSTTSNVDKTQWNNAGFLQSAFTSEGLAAILTTEVENGGDSTSDATGSLLKADGSYTTYPTDYTCPNTNDKIFLLSEQEVTTSAYGFAKYYEYKGDGTNTESTRIRLTTDFAKANYAYQSTTNGYGGYWWLRSPDNFDSDYAHLVYYDGYADDYYLYSHVNYENNGVVPALSIKLQ